MKKNNLILVLFLSITTLFLNSCEDSIEPNIERASLISAGKSEFTLEVQVNTSGTIDIDVFTTDTTSSDRIFNISINEASTGTSSDYTIPSSITVPANENKATLSIATQDVSNTVVLDIEDANGTRAVDSIVLNIYKICPFDVTSFYGTYAALEDAQWSYDVIIAAGPADNTVTIDNLYDTGGKTVVGIDPTSNLLSIRSIEFDAILYVHPTYGNLYANTLADTTPSTYDVCDNGMVLNFIRTVAAGNFTTEINVVLTKK